MENFKLVRLEALRIAKRRGDPLYTQYKRLALMRTFIRKYPSLFMKALANANLDFENDD